MFEHENSWSADTNNHPPSLMTKKKYFTPKFQLKSKLKKKAGQDFCVEFVVKSKILPRENVLKQFKLTIISIVCVFA